MPLKGSFHAGVGVHLDEGRVAHADPHDVVFVHVHLHLHVVEVGDAEHFRTGHLRGTHHPFAQFHAQFGDGAAHGGEDGRFAEVFLGVAQAGLGALNEEPRRLQVLFGGVYLLLGHLQVGLGLEEVGVGDYLLVIELLGAVEFNFCPFQLCLHLRQPGVALRQGSPVVVNGGPGPVYSRQVVVGADFEQDLVFDDRVALGHVQRNDLARHVGADLYFYFGLYLARGADFFHDVGPLDLGQFYLGRLFLADPAGLFGNGGKRQQSDHDRSEDDE
jgi:hypothetical protein